MASNQGAGGVLMGDRIERITSNGLFHEGGMLGLSDSIYHDDILGLSPIVCRR